MRREMKRSLCDENVVTIKLSQMPVKSFANEPNQGTMGKNEQ